MRRFEVPMEGLLTVNQVADFLKVRPNTVHEWVRQRKLACVQLSPKDRRFTEAHVQTFIENQTLSARKIIDKAPPGPLPSPAKGGAKKTEIDASF